MHILVPIQRVVDPNVKVRIKSDGSGLDTAGLKMSINPFDEVALEQALRLREQGLASKVTAVACGPAVTQDVLRTALAMGADAAMLLTSDTPPDALSLARLLQAVVQREGIGLVLCGKQAIDDDLGATGPMLAALLDWPQAISVNGLSLDAGELRLACDGDRGVQRLSMPLPAVLSVDLRLSDPRSVTLPNMMKAKKASITTLPAQELAPLAEALAPVVAVAEPARRPPGVRVADIDALIAQLRDLKALQPA
jgi:electron transfer flavoprotein beta subunit